MENNILYKYRSLENYERFKDIMINQRLWADIYTNMNDPNEGYYWTNPDIPNDVFNIIRDNKMGLRFCCFSKSRNIGLQWTHYADNRKGVVVGVELPQKYEKREIIYLTKHPSISKFTDPHDTAKRILQHKLKAWEYEREVRVFADPGECTPSSCFIDIIVKEILIGPATSLENENKIRHQVDQINTKPARAGIGPIKVFRLNNDDLDFGQTSPINT